MQVVTPDLIQNKKVLLRLDLDVPIENGKILDDFRLKAALPTLKLCLEHAQEVIVMGHIGRPDGKYNPELSVAPIYNWLEKELEELGIFGSASWRMGEKLKLLENLRFEEGESFDCAQDHEKVMRYAKELARLGDIFINEAFASHHPSASTTVLPTLFPDVEDPEGRLRPRRAMGLQFAKEVEMLTKIRENPEHPLVAIIGGVKAEDKGPAVLALSKIADTVLVGGKIVQEFSISNFQFPKNVLIGELNEEKTDITPETVEKWGKIIGEAKMIVWNGPLGYVEEPKNFRTHEIANLIISSGAESIIGGGDTISYLGKLGLLPRFSFVSTGGGAMLKFLIEGTLPTIEALENE